jgi:DNA-directed RNA polymerase subunit RPC12/RpoP
MITYRCSICSTKWDQNYRISARIRKIKCSECIDTKFPKREKFNIRWTKTGLILEKRKTIK